VTDTQETQDGSWETHERAGSGGGYYWSWDQDGILIGTFKGWRAAADTERGGDAGYLLFDLAVVPQDVLDGNPERAVGCTVVLKDHFLDGDADHPPIVAGTLCRITPTGKQGNTRLFDVETGK
jgi:hypothetical protein